MVEPGDGDTRVYGLDPEQAASFGDPDSPAYAGSMALVMGGVGQVLPRLPEVYRTGSGIPFGGYGDDVRLGQALFNRGGFLGQLTQEWVPALPGVAALLSRPGARALDLGCGVGWSSIALAAAYPGLEVLGIDSDDASVMDARANAEAHGVADRVRFEVADADTPLAEAAYDVAFYFEALHDMAHPVESLAAVRSALRPGGVVVVVDERGGGGVRAGRQRGRAHPRGVQRPALPARRALAAGLRGDRRPVPTGDDALVRRPGRLLRGRGRPDRARPVPVLRADAVAAGPQRTLNAHFTGCFPGLVLASRLCPGCR